MSKPFDIELFLTRVLTGSNATRQRHVRQAKIIQAAISERWKRDNPWTWRRKHLAWILYQGIPLRARATRYQYGLTVQLITQRLGKSWQFKPPPKVHPPISAGCYADDY